MSCYTNDIWYRAPIFWMIFLFDRVSKMFVNSRYLPVYGAKITSFLTLKVHYNFGMAWGLFSRLPFGNVIIPALMAIFLYFFAKYTFERQKNCHDVFGETLVMAGGFSNFVDRVPYGPVIDWINIRFGSYMFPAFNIADMAITLGAVIMLYNFLLGDDE